PMRHGLGQNELYPSMATVPESQTLTSWIAEQCVEYILHRRDPDVPFFLWCSFSKPHPPLDPPEPYYSMYRDVDIPDPIIGEWSEGEACPEAFKRSAQNWSLDLIPPEVIREARSAYYGLITQIDYNMGRVFAALQDLDLFNDALMLYTSDHGELLGDHHTGSKTYFYEGAAHVPFALRMPKSWEDRCHGTVEGSPVTHADILPTLVTAAGGVPPAGVDGLDLAAVARGQAAGREFLEASVQGHPYFAITDGRWKYIVYPEGGAEQLFDLETDPGETTDLAGRKDCATQQETLRAELVRRHEARGSGAVEDGAFKTFDHRGDSEVDRRNRSWPGYHTDEYPVDVRH
ncbi:MAG: sulfatase-like hydrolase/transferase, partial [Lentisphaerae bacterium]|nr:sulfatase-like hydrolase/transferase [Lentisphaerota bacterium]